MKRSFSILAAVSPVAMLFAYFSSFAAAQVSSAAKSPYLVHPRDRVVSFIDEQQRATLVGSHHPLARPEYEVGAVKGDFRMDHVIMMLKPDASQQKALDNLLAAQHDPQSAYYHEWLTPETYGQVFGVSDNDLAQITSWLQLHGMTVEEVTAGRRAVVFSGSAEQIASTFHAKIRTYRVGGELHHANATDPQIPIALAGVVAGIASLHDFRSQPLHAELKTPLPAFTSGGAHYLGPADFAAIYDVNPLYQRSLDGTGQAIAIVGRTNINLSDIRLFRNNFGLPANDPQIILNGADPGIVNTNEEVEADLDVQWSGAVARNAAIKFVVSASTNASDGAYLSAQYIVNHNLAPVMSMSFGLCEVALGSSGNSFLNTLWQQAAAQGITVLVSSGDSGAAGCDGASAATATGGRAVNGLCSTPYSVCVGGTQFADTSNASLYWSASNASGTQASALSYIPETVWNESGHSGLWAGGGGASAYYAKPSWQIGPGVPADGKRDVPDVSLASATHDGYLVYVNGGMYVVGGTSAASPSLAGLMALLVQSTATRQGNANTAFYNLANKQASGGAAVFHDVKTGNNSVPGVTGYTAATGYDQATGLGTVDANNLVGHWADALTVPSFQLNAASTSVSVAASGTTTTSLSSSVSGGFSAAVSFSVSGLPAGVTAAFTPASLPAPGSGTTSLKFTASKTAPAGNYSVTASAKSGGQTKTAGLTLTVTPPPTFALTASSSSFSVSPGGSAAPTLTVAPNVSFNAAVSLSAKGLPAGMTVSLSPSSIPAPGSGTVTLTFAASSTVVAGTYSPVITATGGGITQTFSPRVSVPGFTFTASKTSLSLPPRGSGTITVTSTLVAGFNSGVALSVSGMPSGVTATFSPQTLTAPGNGTSTLTITRQSTGASTAKLTISATGGGRTQTVQVTLTLAAK